MPVSSASSRSAASSRLSSPSRPPPGVNHQSSAGSSGSWPCRSRMRSSGSSRTTRATLRSPPRYESSYPPAASAGTHGLRPRTGTAPAHPLGDRAVRTAAEDENGSGHDQGDDDAQRPLLGESAEGLEAGGAFQHALHGPGDGVHA